MDVQFTDREIDVMEVLWERGPSLVAEVQAALRDELAYTTVLTILRTLEGKGYVSRAPEGRGHRYFAAVKQTAACWRAFSGTCWLFPVVLSVANRLGHFLFASPSRTLSWESLRWCSAPE